MYTDIPSGHLPWILTEYLQMSLMNIRNRYRWDNSMDIKLILFGKFYIYPNLTIRGLSHRCPLLGGEIPLGVVLPSLQNIRH